MKAKWISVLVLLVLILSLPLSGMADLGRGSKGAEVKTMQKMLIELGFLNGGADGFFGKKTQDAVKALQEYWGVNTTGALDDDDLYALYDLYFLATGAMEGDGLGEDELQEMYPAFCSWNGADEAGCVFCFRHLEEMWLSEQLEYPNPPQKLEQLLAGRLCELWEWDIEIMYEEWEDSLSDEDQPIAQAQKDLYEAALEEYKAGPVLDEMHWIAAQGIDLCFDLHGAEAQMPEE